MGGLQEHVVVAFLWFAGVHARNHILSCAKNYGGGGGGTLTETSY